MMKDLKQFNIPFVGLKEGNHLLEYQIDNTFFKIFNYEEFNEASINVSVALEKKATFIKLIFSAKGFVNLLCDLSLEAYNQEIDTSLPLLIKFGEAFNDDNEEILILPQQAYEVNVAQYIYEMVILGLPSKRIHPKVADGTLETPAIKKLKELSIEEHHEEEHQKEENIDPRWDKLKNLITEKKTSNGASKKKNI